MRSCFSKFLICSGLSIIYVSLVLMWRGMETENVTQPPPFPSYKVNFIRTVGDVAESVRGLDFTAQYAFSNNKRAPVERKGKYYSSPVVQDYGPSCYRNITLSEFSQKQSVDGQMFFIETSGRSHLNPRQSCSVESAAKESGLKVVVLLKSPILSLEFNVSCHLYAQDNISFYTINTANILKDTPLEELESSGKLGRSKWKMTHYSDALRLGLLYKFGGFYSDLDAVTIRSLRGYKNVVGSTTKDAAATTRHHVANGELQFQPRHRLLLHNMVNFASVFLGQRRVEVGPMLTTRSIKELYNVSDVSGLTAPDLTVLDPEVFFPVRSYETEKLWPTAPSSFLQWKEMFENSSMVHFYGSITEKWEVDRQPAHQAYSILAPRYCPISFGSTKDF